MIGFFSLIFLILFSQVKASPRLPIPQNVNLTCDYLYGETSDVWLMGEVAEATPFAVQLLAVYSFTPSAEILASHLVAGDFSVHEPLVKSKDGIVLQWKLSRRKFSDFIDLDQYQSYFRKHRIHIISQEFYDSCFSLDGSSSSTTGYQHRVAELIRIPEFLPYRRKDFHLIIAYTNGVSLKAKRVTFPLSPHHQLRIKSRYKMSSLYSYWNETNSNLRYALKGIHPAKSITKIVNTIVTNDLGGKKKFIAVHVRLDDDGYNHIQTTATTPMSPAEREDLILQQTLSYIQNHECITQNKASQRTIYLFTNRLVNNTIATRRFFRLTERLRDSGFGKIAVRKSFFSYLAADSYASPAVNQKSFVVIDDATESDVTPLTPEQLTYIDMVVSQETQCFVPSFIPSFTSYMTMRLKRLQENKVDSYNEVSESIYGSSYSYRDWGF